jgi:hypothetical protein
MGWVAGSSETKANLAQLGLSLAIINYHAISGDSKHFSFFQQKQTKK